MITPELLEYVRTEVAKGKTREEIHGALISGGGWSEDDLSEAFREVIPMQNVIQNIILPKEKPTETTPSPLDSLSPVSPPTVSFTPAPLEPSSSPSPVSYPSSLSFLESTVSVPEVAGGVEPEKPASKLSMSALGWQKLIFIIVGLLCIVSWYFYHPQIISFWNKGVESSQKLSINSWNSYSNFFKEISFPTLKLPSFSLPSFDFGKIFGTNKVQNNPVVAQNNTVVKSIVKETANIIKDCGTSVAPKLDDSSTFKNNSVLSCLGASALNCENAKGVLKDDFFPTIFEITKLQDSCNFKLSYGADSALTDVTGKKLVGQYISCPINIVKAIDNTQSVTSQFVAPDKTDLSKYGSQIYFYGILGLFVENNLDQNKIQSLGCSGGYIQSMIASYNLSQKK